MGFSLTKKYTKGTVLFVYNPLFSSAAKVRISGQKCKFICNFSKILHIVRYNVTMLQCYIRNFEMLQEILVYYLYYIYIIYNIIVISLFFRDYDESLCNIVTL